MSKETQWAIAAALASWLPRCGECSHWMKSSECPREHNVKGMSRGPSCNAVACDQFAAKNADTAASIAERRKPADEYIKSQVTV